MELLFATTPRPAPGPTQPIIRLITERLPQRVQKAAPGCYHSPPRKLIYMAQIIMMYQTKTLKLNNKPPYKHRVQEYVELHLHSPHYFLSCVLASSYSTPAFPNSLPQFLADACTEVYSEPSVNLTNATEWEFCWGRAILKVLRASDLPSQ